MRGRALLDNGNALKRLARPKRFELLTPRFVVWCSIQLSYGRALGSHLIPGPGMGAADFLEGAAM